MINVDWLQLFLHMFALSLLAIGGAITTAPEMHRFLVDEQHWLTDSQFTASIAIAQAAPGPNLLFAALFGWHIGLNVGATYSGQIFLGFFGALICLMGLLIPSTTLTFYAAHWVHKNNHLIVVQAFQAGLAPIVIGLLLATTYLLLSPSRDFGQDYLLWLLGGVTIIATLKTNWHILLLLIAGAFYGALLLG
jgi:chromate transporter